MRKWKDDGSYIIKPWQRKIYFIVSILLIIRLPFFYFATGKVYDADILDFVLGFVFLWGINFNGFYKIIRRYAEWQLKKRDNKWR